MQQEKIKNIFLKSNWGVFFVIFLFLIIIFGITFYLGGFGSVETVAELERFTIPVGLDKANIVSKLSKEGFIKNEWAFNFALNSKGFQKDIAPGGYKISKAMDTWRIAEILMDVPYMKWITITEGLRKEEIAEILGKELNWSEEVKNNWIQKDTTGDSDYTEGVYFPDTYLIPVDETPSDIAKRLQNKFQENFAPYAKEALEQNIKWTTAIKLASIIQREASGKNDMALISGILWNRLEKEMRLEVDCTLQYARGDTGNGFWAPISIDDKKIDSPYNTYKNKGLPPTPISNPGLNAIEAVLKPEQTRCLFYLHENKGNIHCTETYEEHKKAIEEYL